MSLEVADGWEDDLDLDDDEDQKNDSLQQEETKPASINQDSNGWAEDDLDLDFFDETDDKEGDNTQGEWSFDDEDDLDLGDKPTLSVPREPPTVTQNPKEERLYQALQDYIASLPRMLPSLNAVLEAEYNTYHQATELSSYYQSRPAMTEYTLETELSRMQYEVILPDGQHLTDKTQVHRYLSQHTARNSPILVRAANQSLLADVLTVLSGPDAWIRQQYLASGVASACRFVIAEQHVHCQCQLQLSLPHSNEDRLNIAELTVTANFAPDSPSLQYHLVNMEVFPLDPQTLSETAAFLAPLVHDEDDEHFHPMAPDHPTDAMRDAIFLQLTKTQQLVEAGQTGMASALKQMDSVLNVTQKLDVLKKLPVLPSTEDILAASEMSTQVSEESRSQPPNDPRASTEHARPSSAGGPPPPAATSRPTPILGGFLRSGWSRLANSVTLPDEEPEPQEVIPRLYRTETPQQKEKPQLYRRDAVPKPPPFPPEQQVSNETKAPKEPLQLYRRDVAPPPLLSPPQQQIQKKVEAPTSTSIPLDEELLDDGWDDDDDLEGLDDDDMTEAEPPVRPPPPPVRVDAPPPPPPIQSQPAAPHPPYNPEDDIVPTRTRWINPHPGPRRLVI